MRKTDAKIFSQKRGSYDLFERPTVYYRVSLLIMDTSQGELSQDIRSLNQISFSFIVLGYFTIYF